MGVSVVTDSDKKYVFDCFQHDDPAHLETDDVKELNAFMQQHANCGD